jgi:hypothetical protein
LEEEEEEEEEVADEDEDEFDVFQREIRKQNLQQ